MKRYIRDGRAPIPLKEATSRVMSANRAKNTGPELILRKALRSQNIVGYKLHKKDIPGRPDISFGPEKLAIFINGCFWHRCPKCRLPLPGSNKDFWKEKFARNKKRDGLKVKKLQALGWRTLTFWECEVEENPKRLVSRVQAFL